MLNCILKPQINSDKKQGLKKYKPKTIVFIQPCTDMQLSREEGDGGTESTYIPIGPQQSWLCRNPSILQCVPLEHICSHSCSYCHTEMEVADWTCYIIQSQHTTQTPAQPVQTLILKLERPGMEDTRVPVFKWRVGLDRDRRGLNQDVPHPGWASYHQATDCVSRSVKWHRGCFTFCEMAQRVFHVL